jgi:spermidine synthase
VRVAEDDFYYLEESAARIEIALGDARLNLEREKPQQFDVLAVDAFSGDSIPTHLITHEAMALYLRHIATDGVVAFHVSNRFLDLPPVLEALARAHALAAVMIEDPAQDDNGLHSSSTWVLIARNNDAFKALAGKVTALPMQPSWRLWTDDYNNLVQVLKNHK